VQFSEEKGKILLVQSLKIWYIQTVDYRTRRKMMELSEEQLKPITSDSKNRLILAGPGTGKSYTILGFILDLINNKAVNPNNIIVLTFTRAATAELKNKIRENIESSKGLPRVFTLHGFALRQLMKNSKNIKKLPENFVIADDYEERWIINEDIKKLAKIPRIEDVEKLFNRLSSNWETLNADRTGWETNFDSPEFIGAWNRHREIYGYVLRSELVYQFKNLLVQEPDANIDGPIDYLIVDEYQDLNSCDLLVVSKLIEKGSSIFCAGDDDQSIYGFRYAAPEGIRNFSKNILLSEQFLIKECRRCDKEILNFALNVIRQDYKRIPKDLISVTGNKGEYHVLHFKEQNAEAEKISEIVFSLNKTKNVSFNDIIILLRNDKYNKFSSVIQSKLKDRSIPVSTSVNFFDFFDSGNGRYLVALLKYLKANENDLALRTLLQLTPGIGEVTIKSIYDYADKNSLRFAKAINEINQKNIDNFHTNLILKKTISEIMSYKKLFNDENKPFVELLDELFSIIPKCDSDFIEKTKKFIKTFDIKSIDEFIFNIIEYFGPNDYDDVQPNGVRIMTMHKAKGLSASAVFVVGVEEENILGRGEIDEERRLLYVSLTRARKYLFITYCKDRIGQQQHSGYLTAKTTRRNLSRYIRDIPNLNPKEGEDFIL
jgi:DNA helicase-2/ATP-dependent DNA helicase PcrA